MSPFPGITDAPDSASAPARALRTVVPHDADNLPWGTCKALYATSDGTIVVLAQADADAVALPVTAGQLVPIRVRRVLATGTTATVLAFY